MTSPAQSKAPTVPDYKQGKQLAQRIFHDTIAAIEVRHAMRDRLKYDAETLLAGGGVHPLPRAPQVVAFGKAANRMASVLHEILGGRVEAGVVVSPAETHERLPNFRYFVGGHPYPNHGSMEGARAALDVVSHLTHEDTVIFLVSGGGSATFEQPMEFTITLADLIDFNRALVTSHLPIEQINVLRKHISAVKGGRVAERAFPARQLTIYISDVPTNSRRWSRRGQPCPMNRPRSMLTKSLRRTT